ncbi:hypothetical protein AAHE18_01G063900 [Arachis hypogaea]
MKVLWPSPPPLFEHSLFLCSPVLRSLPFLLIAFTFLYSKKKKNLSHCHNSKHLFSLSSSSISLSCISIDPNLMLDLVQIRINKLVRENQNKKLLFISNL